MRKLADKVIAPVLLDLVVDFLMRTLYQKLGYCINSTVSIRSDPSFPVAALDKRQAVPEELFGSRKWI